MLDSLKYDSHSPKSVEEIVGNSETWLNLQTLISANRASHVVLAGPPGCGKTLFYRIALARFSKLIVDCTANSGLRDVRDSIRIFARGSRTGDGNLRWIVFEHADALTSDTQAFLRRMLETTAGTTRILFECRDAGAISEPILSRSTIYTVSAPDATEIAYELLRRTNFGLERVDVENIVKYSFGNMRAALTNALALHCLRHKNLGNGANAISEIIASSPKTGSLLEWAIEAEHACKLNGYDLRDVLRAGWPESPIVANTCQIWSRLGGTSPRALFFDCIWKISCV